MIDHYNSEPEGIAFNDFTVNNPSIIKVVGVGGGGGNAVTHMFNSGAHDVTYVLCNTDSKALTAQVKGSRQQLRHG